ncbi:hypothetical protein AHiyo4_32700 [Arthrobacter sp. Hiyo4]|nr:hypothetical protein AHiyo4_32700 [Arthrobacter sp. Hiyo4]
MDRCGHRRADRRRGRPGRPRLNAKAKRAGDVFDAGTTASAEAYRGRAAAAAAAGNWSAAVVDCFRALVRTAEDRTLFDTRPGRTADEVAHELATPFPSEAGRLTDAARTFDGIRYGNESAGQAHFAAMRELDIALQSLTPRAPPCPLNVTNRRFRDDGGSHDAEPFSGSSGAQTSDVGCTGDAAGFRPGTPIKVRVRIRCPCLAPAAPWRGSYRRGGRRRTGRGYFHPTRTKGRFPAVIRA